MAAPPRSRHRDALFSLVAANNAAAEVIEHPFNLPRLSIDQGVRGLEVGFHIPSRAPGTLALLGRGDDVDIELGTTMTCQSHCSFEVEPDTKVLMLHDRTKDQRTKVGGENSTPFERVRTMKKVVVLPGYNELIGVGGVYGMLIQFRLVWHEDLSTVLNKLRADYSDILMVLDSPTVPPTIDDPDMSVAASHVARQRRAQNPPGSKVRYLAGARLGSGSFSRVRYALNMDTGMCMAVKMIGTVDDQSIGVARARMKTEVDALKTISHNHIIQCIAANYDSELHPVEMFMDVYDGSLASLIRTTKLNFWIIERPVLYQMSQALDYLANNDIIHRDVKPDNILYVRNGDGSFHFRLADFNVCKTNVKNIDGSAGTEAYMAPEVVERQVQTTKVDVWSLFATLVWLRNFQTFRAISANDTLVEQSRAIVLAAAASLPYREMGVEDPDERASAAQVLLRHFGGEGLFRQPRALGFASGFV